MAATKTPRDLSAFCEVLDTVVEWFEQRGESIDGVRDALDAVRVAVSVPTPSTREAIRLACQRVSDPDATGARRELLCALMLVAQGAVQITLQPADVTAAERLLLTHATNAGRALGVPDAAKTARLALDRGRAEGRRADRFPEPGFVPQLALGSLLAQYRDLGRLSQEDLVKRAASRGVRISKAQLARIEGGTAARDAPLDALFECVGQDAIEARLRAERAHDLARDLSLKVSGGEPSERWFAESVALFGERVARAAVTLATGAAARLDASKLRGGR